MDNVVLHVADVHKSFAGLHALSDIDLSVKEGETHAIIGPNGAGKSTLLNVCIGRLKPCLLYTSPSPRDRQKSRMPSSA